MNPPAQGFGSLGIDVSLPDHAAEGRLDVAARTAEPIVQVEMAEGGVEIVAPEQAHDPPTQPNAFRKGGGTAQKPGGFGKLVGLPLPVLGVAGLLATPRTGMAALVLLGRAACFPPTCGPESVSIAATAVALALLPLPNHRRSCSAPSSQY